MGTYTTTQEAMGLDWIHSFGFEDDPSLSSGYFMGNHANVGIMDTGLEDIHDDLSPNFLGRFPNVPSTASLAYSHGSHVAGIVAGAGAVQVYGVAPLAKLQDYPVIGINFNTDQEYFENLRDSFVHARTNNIHVLNLSFIVFKDQTLGLGGLMQQIRDEIIACYSYGVIICVAAGNDQSEADVFYNGASFGAMDIATAFDVHDYVLMTASLDDMAAVPPIIDNPLDNVEAGARRVDYSNFGYTRMVRNGVIAPGTQITSTVPENAYDTYDGTSMASPFLAGVAAMIVGFFKEAGIGYDAKMVFDIVKGCVFHLPYNTSAKTDGDNGLYTDGYIEESIYIKGWNKEVGYGCINFELLSRVLMAYRTKHLLGQLNAFNHLPITQTPPLQREELPLALDGFDTLSVSPGWPDVGPPPFETPATDPLFLNVGD